MSERRWSLHHAKNQLGSVVDAAVRGEPQLVAKHGRPAVVVLAVEEYRRLKALEERARPGSAEQLLDLPQDGGAFDTVVLSALRRRQRDPKLVAWLRGAGERPLPQRDHRRRGREGHRRGHAARPGLRAPPRRLAG